MTADKIVDLSHPIDGTISMFPGHPQPVAEELLSRSASEANYSPGTSFVIHRYGFIGNTGTYLDSPFHRFADGIDLAQLDLAATVDLSGLVVDVREQVAAGHPGIGAEVFKSLDLAGRAVLIATGWDRHWSTPAYLMNKPFLDAAGAAFLRDAGVALVGIDNWNIDDVNDPARPAHSILLRVGIPIVENLKGLDRLLDRRHRFFAAPIPFVGGSAIPVRAFAILD